MFDLSKLSTEIRTAYEACSFAQKRPDSVLTVGQDAKTSKGEKLGIRTAVTYLAPHTVSGVNVCAAAILAQCTSACLYSAGRGAMSSVQNSRLRRTLYLQQYPELYLETLAKDLEKHCQDCLAEGLVPAYRPNGTSDNRWENWPAWVALVQMFVDKYGLRVYDYTKLPNRRNMPAWYDLTFSYSGVLGFQPFVAKAKAAGMRIAAVFESRATVLAMLANGEKFLGLDVIDGDDTDVRFLEPQNALVALYAKGEAKKDTSGFVVRDAA